MSADTMAAEVDGVKLAWEVVFELMSEASARHLRFKTPKTRIELDTLRRVARRLEKLAKEMPR